MDGQIRELQIANKSLSTQIDHARQEREQIIEQAKIFQTHHAEAERQKRLLHEQNTKLREIFIKNGQHDNEPVDSVLVKSFCDLREQIQRIVQKQYSIPPARLKSHNNPLFDKQKTFFRGTWMHIDVARSMKNFSIRAKLFEFLEERILRPANFGIGGGMEQCLADFEAALKSCGKGRSSARKPRFLES